MQAVHGWLSTYERLVNSQNFFSPYLTQEDLSCLGRTNFLSNAVIVCRIDDYVIIGARSESLEYTGVSPILSNFANTKAPRSIQTAALRFLRIFSLSFLSAALSSFFAEDADQRRSCRSHRTK